jgi:hypothetical protein
VVKAKRSTNAWRGVMNVGQWNPVSSNWSPQMIRLNVTTLQVDWNMACSYPRIGIKFRCRNLESSAQIV